MIIVQQEITELLASNIPSIVEAWDDATPYDIGEDARVGNYIYRSVASMNTNKPPLTNIGTYWILWGPSNAHALIDLYEDTYTTWAADGTFTFARGAKEVIGIGRYIASSVTIEYLDAIGTVLDADVITTFDSHEAYDLWLYIYAPFKAVNSKVIYRILKKVGVNIRVTFENDGDATSCGYCVAGRVLDMGETLDVVNFPDKRIGSRSVSVANFSTMLAKELLVNKVYSAKAIINIPAMFIIDPNENYSHENLVIIGKINKCDATAEYQQINTISWEIEQNIEV